uniref:pullulanase X25 domain-containing protein n=1 Tax=Prevotella sp. TaxID=59823 RepID=UPI003FF11EED
MRRTIFTFIMLCFVTLTLQAQDVWTAAGSSTIFGSHWDVKDTSNDLTDKGDGIWELTKTGCILEQNVKNEFKVVKNHDWNSGSYPEGNYVFTVKETGTYSVTIQFDANNFEIKVKTTKTGDAVIGEKTWTVAGSLEILGKDWAETATENDMIKQEDNVTYILTKTNLTLAIGTYKYKICANHGWAENYGDDTDPEGNASIYIKEDGIYDVTFTFNSATNKVSATAVPSVTDGISQIASDIKTKKVIFNLQGQRISAPKQGVYIINGKKAVLK